MLYGNATSSVIRNVYYPAVVQSGNRFAYCGNNPITNIEVIGLYYIQAVYDVKFNYGGLIPAEKEIVGYKLVKETWLTSKAKAVASGIMPFGMGDLMTLTMEYCAGIKGGNSPVNLKEAITTLAGGLPELPIGYIAKKIGGNTLKECAEHLFTGVAILTAIKDEDEIIDYDKIAFTLLEKNGISLISDSIEELETTMNKTYEFINSNIDYFTLKIDGQSTLFEIDYQLNEKAWFPNWDIDNYVNGFGVRLSNTLGAYGQDIYETLQIHGQLIDEYKAILEVYQERYEYINNQYAEHMTS